MQDSRYAKYDQLIELQHRIIAPASPEIRAQYARESMALIADLLPDLAAKHAEMTGA